MKKTSRAASANQKDAAVNAVRTESVLAKKTKQKRPKVAAEIAPAKNNAKTRGTHGFL